MNTARIASVLIVAAGLWLGGCGGADAEQPIQQADTRTVTGLLRNNDTSPAGQATGWTVTEDGTGLVIATDVTGVVEVAQQMAGQRVIIRGTMMERLDAGGNKQAVFVAQTVSPAQ